MNVKQSILTFIFKNKFLLTKLYFNLFFAWLPIKKNKIVICSFEGCGYGCNPKYITEEIIKQQLPVEIVWLTKTEFLDKTLFPSQVRLVNFYDRNKCLFEFATSKIWIDNVKKVKFIKAGLQKKKNQFYINTWHGSLGIKRVSWEVEGFKFDHNGIILTKKNCEMTNLMTSNSDFETNVFRNGLRFKNEIIKTGHPRNDIFFKDNIDLPMKIKTKLNIPLEKKVALYIPSFRDSLRVDAFNLDYELLKETLEKQTNQEWEILTKFHHLNLLNLKKIKDKSKCQHDISFYPDTQELLMMADIIISDYSSCMFDFMLTRRPCFIYATDIERYNTERGFYYPLESTPFPIARNNAELMENIINFDKNKYIQDCETFLNKKETLEDGKASERVVDIIRKVLNND